MRDYRTISLWKDVPIEKWQDWHWQMQNSVSTIDTLRAVIHLSETEVQGVEAATAHLKMRISPYICTLMQGNNPDDPLRKQFVPSNQEVLSAEDALLYSDVNADDTYSPVHGLVHRYPTKVLIFPSNYCGSYCRYCFRRKLNRDVETTLSKAEFQEIIKYLQNHPEIEEVILSGGDPLVLSDSFLDYILSEIRNVQTVQIIRIHSRLPVTIPYRITSELIQILTKYKPIFMVIHIDNPAEIQEPFKLIANALVDSGIPCLASSPLLRGVNDNEETLKTLWSELIKLRVKPYYLFHSDPVKGLKHFVVPLERGLEIMRNLYDRMSGLGIPHYCLNVPGGGGHILLSPSYIEKIGKGRYLLTNFEGQKYEFSESVTE